MKTTFLGALHFMTGRERALFHAYLLVRALVAMLDLIGILAIGFMATSIALFLTEGSDPSRQINIGTISIPSITAQTLPFISSWVLALFVVKAALSIYLTRKLSHFLARIEARSAKSIAKTAYAAGHKTIRSSTTYEVTYAIQIGSPALFNQFMNSVGTIVAEGFLFLSIFAAFGFVNPVLAVAALAYFGFIAAAIQWFVGRVMQKTSEHVSSSTLQANRSLSDLAEVHREATVSGKTDTYFQQIYETRMNAARARSTQYVLSGMPRYIVETALIVAITAFALFGTISGDIAGTASSLGVFLSGGIRLTASLLPLQGALLTLKRSIPDAQRSLQFLRETHKRRAPLIEDAENLTIDKNAPPGVSLEGVYFKYQGNEVSTLSDISISIAPGAQAAFIGESGSGKSTIADLITGIIEPTKGKVLLNGREPSFYISNLPGFLAYVPQKPGLVYGTIGQNIALGVNAEDINQARLNSAISAAGLTTFIESLRNGVNTNLGKRKDELSGGQLQRIGLARALYTQPKLLILDEATSALDSVSEKEIKQAIDRMRGTVTVISIAHRLNTIQHADVVFLVEDGAITASGNFQTLLNTNQKIRNLAKLTEINSTGE